VAFAFGPGAKALVVALGALTVAGSIYVAGYNAADRKCAVADLRLQIAVREADAEIARSREAASIALAHGLAADAARNKEIIDALKIEPTKHPVGACRVDRALERRLRDIR
jgi:hypothetical protein